MGNAPSRRNTPLPTVAPIALDKSCDWAKLNNPALNHRPKCGPGLECSSNAGNTCKYSSGINVRNYGFANANPGPYPQEMWSDLCASKRINVKSPTELICKMTNVDNKFNYALKNVDNMKNVDKKFNYTAKY
jgi:hypothetical protein